MQKLDDLKRYLNALDEVVVAYSGGVDSSLVAKVAKDLKSKRAQIVSFVTPLVAEREVDAARALSRAHKLDAQFIALDSLELDEVKYNQAERCYHCKHYLFSELKKRFPNATILDGSNYDDLFEERPGLIALRELEIKSPLAELKITKREVRELATFLGLENAQKLSAPCLATRFTKDREISPELLAKVERAEAHIAKIYAGDFRIRVKDEGFFFELKG